MATIFSQIIDGTIPSYKIYEDGLTYAFLTIGPYTHGHTLVVPKVEVDHIMDLEEPHYSAVFATGQKIAKAIQKATGCERVSYMVAGLEVPHVHLHLIPTNSSDDLQRTAEHKESHEKLSSIQQKIQDALQS